MFSDLSVVIFVYIRSVQFWKRESKNRKKTAFENGNKLLLFFFFFFQGISGETGPPGTQGSQGLKVSGKLFINANSFIHATKYRFKQQNSRICMSL